MIDLEKTRKRPNSYWKKRLKQFQVGQEVEVYSLIGCVDFIGIKKIKLITPMNSSPKSLPMIYFEEGGVGAWHVGAIRKICKNNKK